jgi:hypothetical protein
MKSDLFNFSDFDSQLSKIKKLMKNTKSSKRRSSTTESSDISFNTDETKQTDDTRESDNTNETDQTKSDISFDNSSEDIKLKNKKKFLQHLQKIAVKQNGKNGKNGKNEKNVKNVKNGRNEKNNKDNNNQSKYKYNDDSSDDSIMELQKFAKQLNKKGNSIRSNNTDDTNGIQMTADDLTDTISGIISKELNRR